MDVQEKKFRRVTDDPPQNHDCRQVTLLPPSTGLLSSLSGSMSSMSIDGHSERSLTAENISRHMIGDVLTRDFRRGVNIKLPNDVLMEIFDRYLGEDQDDLEVDAWYPLVHVCRNWRNIVFSSPHRLNLRLLYTAKPGKPACEMLGVWPPFPIIIQVNAKRPWSVPNVLAALKHKDRIRKIRLVAIGGTDLRTILLEMQEPFPALTDLVLMSSTEDPELIIPESFLGGFAPRLRSLTVDSIPVRGLPKLALSSARDLVELSLLKIPRRSGYIEVDSMVTALSELTKLETLSIEFESRRRDGHREDLPPSPPRRYVLPSLKSCLFQGICSYLEDFVAMIHTPRLEILDITLRKYDDHTFSSDRKEKPQFNRFLLRTKMFKALNNASIHFWSDKLEITLSRKPWACNAKVTLKFICPDKSFTLARVCDTHFLPLSKIESLGISSQYHKWQSHWEASDEDNLWLFLFYFSAVKSLYLSKEVVPSVASGLKVVMDSDGRLPMLLRSVQKISTSIVKPLPSGSVKTTIERFAAMQGLSAPDPPTIPFCWVANKRNASDL